MGVEWLIPTRSSQRRIPFPTAIAFQKSHLARCDRPSTSASNARDIDSTSRIRNASAGELRRGNRLSVRAASQESTTAGQSAVRTEPANDGRSLDDIMAGVTLLSLDGSEVPITSLWESRRAVVAWARHFGYDNYDCLCMCGKPVVHLQQ